MRPNFADVGRHSRIQGFSHMVQYVGAGRLDGRLAIRSSGCDISKVGSAYYAYKFHARIFCIFFAYFGIYMQLR